MTRDEVLALMGDIAERVRGEVSDFIRAVTSLLLSLNIPEGEKFRYRDYPEIEKEIDRLLKDLADRIYDMIEEAVISAEDEDDDENIIPLWFSQNDVRSRIDSHCSNLKTVFEAFIGAMIAKKVVPSLMPALYPSWIAVNKFHFGRGVNGNPGKALSYLAEDTLYSGFIGSTIRGFRNRGAVGYQVYRGSGYDCEVCDEICFGGGGYRRLYTFDTDIPIPAHPHCVCYAVPVYDRD